MDEKHEGRARSGASDVRAAAAFPWRWQPRLEPAGVYCGIQPFPTLAPVTWGPGCIPGWTMVVWKADGARSTASNDLAWCVTTSTGSSPVAIIDPGMGPGGSVVSYALLEFPSPPFEKGTAGPGTSGLHWEPPCFWARRAW